jgi:hypothetical protein
MPLKPGDIVHLENGIYLIVEHIRTHKVHYVFFPTADGTCHPPANVYDSDEEELQKRVDREPHRLLFNMDELIKKVING